MKLDWQCKKFSELDTATLYEILKLRSKVFIVEQKDPYLDIDDQDQNAWHILGFDNDHLTAYARILLKENGEKTISFGRVIIAKNYRGQGLADQLMLQVFTCVRDNKLTQYPFRISAQTYLVNFYSKHDFQTTGEEYLDGITPHIDMIRPPLR